METASHHNRRPAASNLARNLRRAGALGAAFAAAGLIAGCGTSSGGSTPAPGSSTSTTAAFNPQLVPKGGSSPGKKFAAAKKKDAKGKSSRTSASSSHSGSKSGGSHSSAGSSSNGSTDPKSSSGSSGSGGGTVTVTHTITITRTRYVDPNVPVGAGLPSSLAPRSVSHFAADHGNIGCAIIGATVRCDVGSRVWTPPTKPSTCWRAWGQGIFVGPSGSPQFVCAGDSVLDPTGTYLPAGYDDKVGSVTCQVRAFGVTCFQPDGHGFFIGRTGYTLF